MSNAIKRKDVKKFAKEISKDFVAIVPILVDYGINIAIATHSDLAEHFTKDDNPREGDPDESQACFPRQHELCLPDSAQGLLRDEILSRW